MFKAIALLLLAGTAACLPTLASAQDHAGLTRAQVVAELAQLEKAGYDNPGPNDHMSYPAHLQAAEATVAAQNSQASYAQVKSQSAMGLQAAQ